MLDASSREVPPGLDLGNVLLRPHSSPSEGGVGQPTLPPGRQLDRSSPVDDAEQKPPSPTPRPPPLPKSQPHQPLRPRPSTATLARLLKKPSLIGPFLRGMQSFDSGRTERQSAAEAAAEGNDSPPETPPRADPVLGLQASDAAAAGELGATGAGPDLWEWLASAATEDDPRFILWRLAGGNGGHPPTTPTFSPAQVVPDATAAATAIVVRQLLAATLARWIHQLTSALDSDGAFDFLLVYRQFCPPATLLAHLTSRFEWACGLPSSLQQGEASPTSEGGSEGASSNASQQPAASDPALVLARTRTMRVLAFWLSTFFEEDWLPSVALRRQLTSWLNGLRHRPELDGVLGARSLLKRLKVVVKDHKRAFDTPAGQAVYQARTATTSATSFSSVDAEDADDGRGPGRSQSTGARRSASSSAAVPPPLFPTRRRPLSTFSPPSSPPAPLPKHGMSKLWGSIGRAATRSRLSTGPSTKIVTGDPYAAVGGGSTSFDDLFQPATSVPPTADGLAHKPSLEAYLVATHATRRGRDDHSPMSISDPESRSSHSSSTAATTTTSGDEAELEPPAMTLRPPAPASPLEKVDEECTSSDLAPPEKRSPFGARLARSAVPGRLRES